MKDGLVTGPFIVGDPHPESFLFLKPVEVQDVQALLLPEFVIPRV